MHKGGTRLGLALAAAVWAMPALATENIAIQVNSSDPQVMNMALNNALNLIEYYKEQGEEVNIELVTYGPGLNMLRSDTSPVKARIEDIAMTEQPIHFRACANTIAGMTKKQGVAPPMLEEAEVVPSGAAYLVELQKQGYSYIKP
ncbi:MAG: DsrE family protein [Thioclava marina]|jgi:Uncharacterized conserved protein|uniref:Intracellular sulfur oxidation protein, DsrE/DsrF family n=1 Tax=Thioclava marina TaxID=1915077 RepID=A0ABX3MK49_9RHOB|nr:MULTISPECIES: DsrE family protein [Thioclava]TNE94507.1 MAG: hypothetical protein EP337_00750 [Paracoccaceae bacterium]MBC7147368.1 DsrE family protein [Thioclava marina]MBD3803048.1 DsrE family protein [Thioclava sp.]OOY11825.1 hypothetical protein BMG00_12130 [Thioclava marina]OOY26878.1 hypothetical protein BMI90_15780 [Thioclava sp. L04-15]